MDACTENFECLVINNNAKSNRIEDQVFWYKAEPHDNFRMGAPEFWALNKELNKGDDDEDDEEMFNIADLRKKKGPYVNIKKGI